MNVSAQVDNNPFVAFKIITLGDAGIGKTCLTIRYCQDQYANNKQATIGIDFKDKRLMIGQVKVRLNIFDTAGQESYNSLVKSYYREVDAVIFAYAITDKKSFNNVRKWAKQFNNNTQSSDALKILVGTQCDRSDERVVQKQQGMRLMEQLNCTFFFQTSAKENLHINEVFQQITRNLLLKMFHRRVKIQTNNKSDLIQILSQQAEKGSNCC